MPIEVGDVFNQFTARITKLGAVDTIVRNPLYTALLITAVIVLIILFIFRDVDTEESLLSMSLRAGFWILILTMGVLFLHHKVLSNEFSSEAKNSDLQHIFKGSHSGGSDLIDGAVESALMPVKIDTNFD